MLSGLSSLLAPDPELDLLGLVSELESEPGVPVKIVVPSSVLLAVGVIVALPEAVFVFGPSGSLAPQGWSCWHDAWQALSVEGQFLTHWVPHSWQTKKGSVRVYSVMLGF